MESGYSNSTTGVLPGVACHAGGMIGVETIVVGVVGSVVIIERIISKKNTVVKYY
jgi:hypothetical protein